MPRSEASAGRGVIALELLSLRDRMRLLGLALAGVVLAGFLIGAQVSKPHRASACGAARSSLCAMAASTRATEGARTAVVQRALSR